MTLSITIKGNTSAAFTMLKDRVRYAEARALNRSGGSGRAVLVRGIATDLGIKQASVRELIQLQEATPERRIYRLTATGKRIPLIEFGAKGPEPSRGKGRGVSARVPGGAGRYPRAFIATMRTGHRGVFERKGRARLPIRELRVVSLPYVFDKVAPEALARANEVLPKNLQHEIDFEVSQIRKTLAA